MRNIKDAFISKNITTGYIYFYVHFATEVACFYVLSSLIGSSSFLWMCPLIYDTFAFVPQSLIGALSDKYPKLNIGLIGVLLLFLGLIFFFTNIIPGLYTAVIILCLGNAFIHVAGAEVTLRCSNGKLAHSAIFVSGGSFGVITGKILAKKIPYLFVALWILTLIPCVLLAETYKKADSCDKFNYHNNKLNKFLIVILSVIVVIVRGYMGYGLPTSWNKTILQTIILYISMGLGKALGGILSDAFGIRKVALLSTIVALPFLLIGDNLMIISLIGVLFFSMTMSITLALLTSVLKNKPGIAFGLTTIGLFLGTLPIFFFKLTTTISNCIVISILTIICVYILMFIIRKDDKNEIN